jgi:hypothetical protein
MRRRSFMGKAFVLAVGCLFTSVIVALALSVQAQANQSAEQAYDQYIGHFGANNVKPPYIGEISSK